MKKKLLGLSVATAALLMSALPASANVACGGFTSASGQCRNTTTTVGGTSYNADWYLPNGTASALMVLEHGLSRRCGNLRNTSKAIMERGVMVVCFNASMLGGNPAFGKALGDALASRTVTPPNGATLPVRYIVGGHSAGANFASGVGSRLVARGYPELRGAVLLDPVAADGFSANLAALGNRPVLTVAARSNAFNAFNNAFPVLRGLPGDFPGVQLTYAGYVRAIPYGGSCHTDAEGENTDLIGSLAVACTPNSGNVARLREFASVWAADMAAGTQTAAYYCQSGTCGVRVRELLNQRQGVLIPGS